MEFQKCTRGGGCSNLLSALPHLNGRLNEVSNNLAAYDFFHCPNNRTHCKLSELEVADVGSFAFKALSGRLRERPQNSSDPKNYVQAVALYYYVGLAFALLSLLLLLAALVWLCLRKAPRVVSWSRPGSRRQSSKQSGSIPDLPKFDVAKRKKRRRWASVLLGLYAIATVCFILVGVFKGALSMAPAAQRAFVHSPTALARVLQTLNPPLQTFLAASGATIADTLRQANQSIVSTVDLQGIRRDVMCAQNGQQQVPNNGTLETVLTAVQATYQQIPDSQAVGLQLAAAQEESANLSRTLPPVSASLQEIAATGIDQTLLPVGSSMSLLNQSMDILVSSPSDLDSFQASFQEALSAADLIIDGDGTGGLIGQLQGLPTKGCPDCLNGAQYRQQLVTMLTQFQGALENVTTSSPEVTALIGVLQSLPDLGVLATQMRALDNALMALPSFSELASNLTLLDGALNSDALSGLYASMEMILNAPTTVQTAVATLNDLSGNLTQLNAAIDTYGPCVRSIREQLAQVNATLIRLPHTLDSLSRQLTSIRTHPLVLPNFVAIQNSIQSFLVDIQFLLPVIQSYQAPFALTANLTGQLTGNLSLVNLTSQANLLAHKTWSLELQAAQIEGLAPTVSQLNVTATQFQQILSNVSNAKAPLSTALQIFLSPSTVSDTVSVIAAAPQLARALSAFRAAAAAVFSAPLPDFATVNAGMQPLQGLSEHVASLQEYAANIDVFAQPALSNLIVDLSSSLQALPNLADVTLMWGQLSFQTPAAPLNLTAAIAAARKVGAQSGLMSADNFTTIYNYLDRANELLYGTGDVIVTQLESAGVNVSSAENKTETVATGILNAIDQIYALATNSSSDPFGTAKVRSGLKVVGRIADYNGNGTADSMAYLARVSDVSKGSNGTNSSEGRYFTFKRDACQTDACLSNSLNLLFRGKLSEAGRIIFGCAPKGCKFRQGRLSRMTQTSTRALDTWRLSLQGTLVLAYIFPASLASLSVISGVFPRRWLAITVAVSLMVTTPFTVLISGGLEAPLGIVAADFCGSVASLTVKLLDTTAPNYHISLSDQSIIINPSLVAASVLRGNCSASDDVTALWQNVSRAVVPYVPLKTASWLGTRDNLTQGSQAGHVLEALVKNGSAEISALLQQLIQSGESVASCQKMHAAYVDIHQAVCCDLVESVQWYLGSWYFIALLMLFVGTPASLLSAYYCPRWEDVLAAPRNPEEVLEGEDGPAGSLEISEASGRPVIRAPSTLEEPLSQESEDTVQREAESDLAGDSQKGSSTVVRGAAELNSHMQAAAADYVPWTATWASSKAREASAQTSSALLGLWSMPRNQSAGYDDSLSSCAAAQQVTSSGRLSEESLARSDDNTKKLSDSGELQMLPDSPGIGKETNLSGTKSFSKLPPDENGARAYSRAQIWSALARAGSWRHKETTSRGGGL